MRPVEIADGIFDVGVNDWNIRDFHGYSTHLGTSYNAFLVLDEKTALIDTVKPNFDDRLIENIAKVVDPKKIDLVVSNHTELDHSGALPRVMHKIGEDKPIYCSKMGKKNLKMHFPQSFNYYAVENGEVLSLGKRSLTFLETRMIHWPDSMFTYMPEEKILFSSDGFGQHYAGMEKFDDVIGEAIMPHAKKYFANILLLYTPKILKLLESVAEMGIEIKTICPDHGVIWRRDPGKIIDAYARWSRQEPARKALVIYDTMWNSTEMLADAVTAGIAAHNVDVRPMNLRKWHRSDVMTEVLDARAIVLGSPTLNNGLFPTVSDMLTYMKGLRPKDKIGAAFGSYGWSGESVRLLNEEMEAMKFEVIDPGLKVQYVPQAEALENAFALGEKVGRAVVEGTEKPSL